MAVRVEPALELARDLVRRLRSRSRVLLETAEHERGDGRVELGPQRQWVRGALLENGLQHGELVFAGERTAAAQELEQHHTEAEQVAAAVDSSLLELFRRDVAHRAARQLAGRDGEAVFGLCQPEVGDLDLAMEAHEHVRARKVTVHEVQELAALRAQIVGGGQAARYGETHVDHEALGKLLACLEHVSGEAGE